MGKFLLGLIVGVVVVVGGAMVYVSSGQLPVGADEGPMPFERYLAGHAIHARVNKMAPQRDITLFKNDDLVAGAKVYRENCSVCHGLPQQPAPTIAEGMFPDAPQLFTPDGTVTDDPVGVSYWKVQNGLRLTGMPSFKAALSDRQMWDVAAVVAQADKLPQTALDELKPAPAPTTSSQAPAPAAKLAK
jgi:thiosulfate dehydrogenase